MTSFKEIGDFILLCNEQKSKNPLPLSANYGARNRVPNHGQTQHVIDVMPR